MILDSTTKRIRAYLAGAPTTQPDWITSWADHNLTTHAFTPGHSFGVMTGTTPVVLIAPPASGFQRQAKLIGIYNRDVANVTTTVEVDDGTSQRKWVRALLEPDWSLQWEPGGTWHIYDENGILQTNLATAPAGSITVEEVDGTPSLVGTTVLRFDQADGFVVSQPGAGIARVDFTGGGASTAYRRWAFMFGG